MVFYLLLYAILCLSLFRSLSLSLVIRFERNSRTKANRLYMCAFKFKVNNKLILLFSLVCCHFNILFFFSVSFFDRILYCQGFFLSVLNNCGHEHTQWQKDDAMCAQHRDTWTVKKTKETSQSKPFILYINGQVHNDFVYLSQCIERTDLSTIEHNLK